MIGGIVARVVMILAVFGIAIYLHEMTHIQVDTYHGCLDHSWHIGFDFLGVRCVDYRPYYMEHYEQVNALQSWVDIVGYHSMAFLLVLCLIILKKWR
jgi:hypothetical protein